MQEKLMIKPVKSVSGNISLPGSKSISNRALLLSAVAKGTTILKNLLDSDDISYMLSALKQLNITYHLSNNNTECRITGNKECLFNKENIILFLGNAGTVMRPLLAMLSLGKNNIVLTGNKRMQERPIEHLVNALSQGGARIQYINNKNYPPIRVQGEFLGGIININGSISSQFLSAILMAAPMAKNNTNIIVDNILVSKPYIKMTIKLMEIFGVTVKVTKNYQEFHITGNQHYISPKKYYIESDLSSATYFIAAAAIKGGPLKINGVKKNSIQGDLRFINILQKIGVSIIWTENAIVCSKKKLLGIEIDCNDIPDAAMTIAMIGLFTQTSMHIKNIYNWRVKETDRLTAMSTELRKVGATVTEGKDYIIISPPKKFLHAVIETYDDHRIAMCFSLVALSGIPVTLLNPKCVKKTFPLFFKYFLSICHR